MKSLSGNAALSQTEVQQVRTNGIATPIPQTNAPAFTLQPVGSTNKMGDRVVFSASATGTHPLIFQWYKNETSIANATNTTLVLTDLTTATTHTYRVDVANLIATNSSDTVTLVVLPDPASNIPSGLLSSWPFNTVDANTNSPDLYSQFNMALVSTNPAVTFDGNNLVAGQFGNALSFNGTSQYTKRVGGAPIYNNLNYSVSLWVNGTGTNQLPASRVYAEGSTSNNTPLFTLATDAAGTTAGLSGVASVLIRNDANVTAVNGRPSTRIVFDGTWHHLVWVDENGKGKLYVDGILDETDFSYVRGALTANTTSVGAVLRAVAGNFFNGSIDDVAVWNRRLTYTEIQEIKNLGVPAPVSAIPPSITVQPVDQTNNIFTGDTVSFSVQAVGTSPLSYRWNKNGSPMDGVANPSALTNVLTITNVQSGDAGNYFVTVTNVAGTTNSITVQLVVTPYTPTTNGTALSLDFDLGTTPDVQPGFSRMVLATNPNNFGSVKVTLSTIGTTAFSDRHRSTPTNNPPLIMQAQIYDDFIFSTGTADGTGMKILVERLAPNTTYGLTIWSYDVSTTFARLSDWTETASGSPVTVKSGYSFDGAIPPTHDYDNTLGALVTASSTGKLQIEGVKNGGAGISVFVNGLRLVANPVMRIASAELVGGNLRLTIETQYPNQPITIQEKTDLGSGIWSTPVSGGVTETHGPIVTAEFPASADQTFYRVTSP